MKELLVPVPGRHCRANTDARVPVRTPVRFLEVDEDLIALDNPTLSFAELSLAAQLLRPDPLALERRVDLVRPRVPTRDEVEREERLEEHQPPEFRLHCPRKLLGWLPREVAHERVDGR